MPTGGDLNFNGLEYLQQFLLPDLFFHTTTAYAILRKSGAPLGKLDFSVRASRANRAGVGRQAASLRSLPLLASRTRQTRAR